MVNSEDMENVLEGMSLKCPCSKFMVAHQDRDAPIVSAQRKTTIYLQGIDQAGMIPAATQSTDSIYSRKLVVGTVMPI